MARKQKKAWTVHEDPNGSFVASFKKAPTALARAQADIETLQRAHRLSLDLIRTTDNNVAVLSSDLKDFEEYSLRFERGVKIYGIASTIVTVLSLIAAAVLR